MSTSYGATPPGITGTHYGGADIGILGSLVPTEGLDGPGYLAGGPPAALLRGPITRWPAGTLVVYEDSAFSYTGPSDYALYQLYVDGQASSTDIGYGPGIGQIDLGMQPGGSLSGGVLMEDVQASGQLAGATTLGGNVVVGDVVPEGTLHGGVQLLPGIRRVHADRTVPLKLMALDSAEIDVLTFEYSRVLQDDEIVIAAVPTVEARIGEDPAAASIYVGSHEIHGTGVRQRISGATGLPGVTYLMRCVATLNTGRVVVAAAFIRVFRRA